MLNSCAPPDCCAYWRHQRLIVSHPASFHVMLSVSVAAPLFPQADVNETYKRTGPGRSWPPDADSFRNYMASLNNGTPVPVPDRDRRIRRNQYLLTVMEFVVRRSRWPQDCVGNPERIGARRSSFLSHCYEHLTAVTLCYLCILLYYNDISI